MTKKKSVLFTILGTMLTGFGVGSFLTPNQIVSGGISGLSTILYHTLHFEPGISFWILNVLLLLIGFHLLGKAFILKTLMGSTMLSLFVQLFTACPIYTENLMLSVIFGGALYGLGIGLSFASGASTGGTDIIGRMIQIRFPHIPIGKLLLLVDGLIIGASSIVFGNVELVLFGVITLLVSTFTIDVVIGYFNSSCIAYVITDRGAEIATKLVSTSPRGVTLIDVHGVYSNTDKKMLFCALKERETEEFQKKILQIDEGAFIVFAKSHRIKGNGFHLYK